MKFLKMLCRLCKADMVVQHGSRGYYYRCSNCKVTINKRPILVDSKRQLVRL